MADQVALAKRPTNVRWMILGIACFTSFLTYLHRYSWGVVRPYVKEEYGLSDTMLGTLDSAFSLTYFLGQFPGGMAGDLWGPRAIIPLVAVLWSAAAAGPVIARGFWQLFAVRLLFGLAQAPCYPNLGKITQSWFPLSIRTSVQGLVASFAGRAGGALAPVLIAALLMGKMGLPWRTALLVLASLGGLFALGFWLLFRNSPRDHSWSNEAEVKLIEEGSDVPTKKGSPAINWTAANRFNVGVFMAASFFSTFADNLFVFYMPQFLKEAHNFSDLEMGTFAGLPLLGGALGGLCGGALNDIVIRVLGNRRIARSLVAGGGKVIAAVLIGASISVEDGRLAMGVLFFCKFFSDWSQPTWWGTVTDIGGPAAGRVFGMVNMVGTLGGFLAGPSMGAVKDHFGWTALFLFVGITYVLTTVSWACVDCTKKLVGSSEGGVES